MLKANDSPAEEGICVSLFRKTPFISSWIVALSGPEVIEEHSQEAQKIFALLRDGNTVSDTQFDRIYPLILRNFSKVHWTPVSIARRAASLLVQSPGARVLDIGSGCGKFCMIGALTTEGDFLGIEQRDYLAEFSNNLVARHQLPRVSYLHGNMADLDWSSFEAFYLYNPFHENVAAFYEDIGAAYRIDHSFPLGEDRHSLYIETVQKKLKTLKSGTRVVTYHGFGGAFPKCYRNILREPHGTDALELWVKDPD